MRPWVSDLTRWCVCVALLAAIGLLARSCVPSPGGAGEIWRKAQHYECDRACEWVRTLMQPDNPMVSCCGEADRFETDDYEVVNGELYAIITTGEGQMFNGLHVKVPPGKLKWDAGNPTGHGQIFMNGPNNVYCYVPPGGV